MNNNQTQLNLIHELDNSSEWLPSKADFETWIANTFAHLDHPSTDSMLNIAIIDSAHSQSLNKQFRDKDRPTNVLSFPNQNIPGETTHSFGDLAMCAQVINHEASAQQIEIQAHWAHITVHGTLHLLGYDHETEKEAQQMEAHEVAILSLLGYANPYQE